MGAIEVVEDPNSGGIMPISLHEIETKWHRMADYKPQACSESWDECQL